MGNPLTENPGAGAMLRVLRISALAALGLLATTARADRIYWVEADWAEIQRVNLDGSGFELLLGQHDVSRPHSIALDMMQGKMYITDGNRIWRANLDGSDLENPIWDSGIYGGIAIDSVGEKIYWCNFIPHKIQRADLDGSNIEELVTGLDRPEFIALDLAAGKMYWSDREAGKIQRANLDGTEIEDLVTGLGQVNGIALDVPSGKMYWADITDDAIRRAGMEIPDGETPGTRTDIEDLVGSVGGPLGVALDLARGHIYWVAQNDLWIRRADIDGGNVIDIVETDEGVPLGLALEFIEPGLVPESISVDKSALVPNAVTLSWLPSCTHGAADYAIYEGEVGNWFSHAAVDCSDDGSDLQEEIMPLGGDRYFLVVPLNYIGEGSYGEGDGGAQRPVGTPACLPTQSVSPCP
jgi:sugar lactone lactonase YvrE